MAPETSYVHCPKCGQDVPFCGIGGERITVSHTCPPATLTCSEVVERLAKLFHIEYEALGTRVREHLPFDRTQATHILEQWRERRVQELERLHNAFRSGSPTDLWSAAKEVFGADQEGREA